ncbi:MAG: methylenetetrahydrofolate--tRNA-(uracil(54)-C(5))-methyltransferase (FADH(2)-oxidizing) TrmFO [Gemmatimonadota bacterium]
MNHAVTVIGGGLAGCEAALQLAAHGHKVCLIEMRPAHSTAAHQTDLLGELVCTNSFKSEDPANAHGQLKREMAQLGSILLRSAAAARVPAGSALAVDRERFAGAMTAAVREHPGIELQRREVRALPEGPTVVATGPLTSDALSEAIRTCLGSDGLAFFDAIAPIVHRESLDESIVFAAGRFEESDDYLNCPFSKDEYEAFIDDLLAAEVHDGHDWDRVPYFEGCLPIEVMASRGRDTLRFGPMKPIGLTDPRTGRRPWAVLQLRREDAAGQMLNLVGFQTRMKVGAQAAVFRRVPGLAGAEFLRWGSIHRNTYLNFPAHLLPHGGLPGRPDLVFAGQLTGVEGYTESAASGILAGINLDRILTGRSPVMPPATTMLGGLLRFLREADPMRFQPMNSNWGLVDPLPNPPRGKPERREALAARAQADFERWVQEESIMGTPVGVGGIR